MRTWLRRLVVAGLLLGALLTGLGLLASWRPVLDIVNNGLPFLILGALVVFGLACLARAPWLIAAAAALAAINILFGVSALRGAAAQAPPGSERALRVLTFNLSHHADRIDEVVKYIDGSGADAVVLQEVFPEHGAELLRALKPAYPFASGDAYVVVLSKHPILAEGRIDRPGFPEWNQLMLRWVRLKASGTEFELAGVHLARPFYPTLQQEDVEALTHFVLQRSGPLVVAGDFNMSPWTEKLARFTYVTGLERYNTFHLTWPMGRRDLRLPPLVAIDNVFASRHFAKLGIEAGPFLGSDHKPVIADLALAAPQQQVR